VRAEGTGGDDGEERLKECSKRLSCGIAWVGRERDCRDTREVVIVEEEEAASSNAHLRRISLFPLGEPQEMPRMYIMNERVARRYARRCYRKVLLSHQELRITSHSKFIKIS